MRTYLKVRSDIEGYGAVADAVKAVETVAASHIQRIRNAALAGNSYVETLKGMLAECSRHYQFENNRLLRSRPVGARVLLILGGDRGMVGGLYNEMIALAAASRPDYDRIVVAGERMEKYAKEEGLEAFKVLTGISDAVSDQETRAMSDYAVSEFFDGDWRTVDVLYPTFVSLAVQKPVIVGFLPFKFMADPADEAVEARPLGLPIFDPSRQAVADELLKRFAALYFRSIASEAKLAEFAARTLAMEHAGNKAQEQIDRAKLNYFKERRRDFSQKQIESFFTHRSL